MEVELTKDWINKSLNELVENNELSYCHLDPLEGGLKDLFKQKINNKHEINAHEFLIACVGSFIFYDLKQQKYSPPASLHERNRGIAYSRSLNYLDIEEIKERFNRLFDDLLEKLSVHCALDDKKTIFSWFGLIDRLQKIGKFDLYISRYRTGYIVSDIESRVTTEQKIELGAIRLIPEEFIQHIFYDHYGLAPKIAKDGLPLVSRHNAEEAAKRLGISKHNLIKECLDASLGAYINSGQFQIQRTVGSRYNQEIIEAVADVSYPYKYHGLVRLSKPELKILYSEEITTNGKDFKLIQLQPSLAEVIQTLSLFIVLRGKQRITIDDLLLVEDEILAYLRKPESVLIETPKAQATTIADDRIGFLEDDVQSLARKPPEIISQKMSTTEIQEPIFSKNDDLYEITYQSKTIQLPCSVGLNRLAYLIQNPNIKISPLELAQKFNRSNYDSQIEQNSEGTVDLAEQGINSDAFGSNDPVNDKQAQREYKNKATQLTNEIKVLKEKEDEAKAKGDSAQAGTFNRHSAPEF